MASRQRLKRIGEEGFSMIDQAEEEKPRCLYRPTKPTVHYPQPPSVTQVHRIVTPPQITYSQYQFQQPATVYQATPQNLENNITYYNPQPGSAGHYLQPPSVTQVHRIVTPPSQITYNQHQLQQPATVYQATPQNLENMTAHYNPPPASAGRTRVIPAPVTTRDQASAGVIDCYEAARKYGGMLVTDYYPNKKVMMHRISKAF